MRQVYAYDSFVATHWETESAFPPDDKPLHYPKSITPMEPLDKVEEEDLFRKKRKGGSYY